MGHFQILRVGVRLEPDGTAYHTLKADSPPTSLPATGTLLPEGLTVGCDHPARYPWGV